MCKIGFFVIHMVQSYTNNVYIQWHLKLENCIHIYIFFM